MKFCLFVCSWSNTRDKHALFVNLQWKHRQSTWTGVGTFIIIIIINLSSSVINGAWWNVKGFGCSWVSWCHHLSVSKKNKKWMSLQSNAWTLMTWYTPLTVPVPKNSNKLASVPSCVLSSYDSTFLLHFPLNSSIYRKLPDKVLTGFYKRHTAKRIRYFHP